jgi:hypothetical protein
MVHVYVSSLIITKAQRSTLLSQVCQVYMSTYICLSYGNASPLGQCCVGSLQSPLVQLLCKKPYDLAAARIASPIRLST